MTIAITLLSLLCIALTGCAQANSFVGRRTALFRKSVDATTTSSLTRKQQRRGSWRNVFLGPEAELLAETAVPDHHKPMMSHQHGDKQPQRQQQHPLTDKTKKQEDDLPAATTRTTAAQRVTEMAFANAAIAAGYPASFGTPLAILPHVDRRSTAAADKQPPSQI